VTQSKSAKLTRDNKRLIEAAGRHSGDYLLAIASCDLSLDDKIIRTTLTQLLVAIVALIE